MKAFITQYALTSGIEEVESAQCSDRMISVKRPSYTQYFHKPGWHESREDAVKDAENRRVRKIASLEKQITKLRALKFA